MTVKGKALCGQYNNFNICMRPGHWEKNVPAKDLSNDRELYEKCLWCK